MNSTEYRLIYIRHKDEMEKEQHLSINLVDGVWVTTGDLPVDEAARHLFNRLADFANSTKTPLEHMIIAHNALEADPRFAQGQAHSVVFHLGAALKAYERYIDAMEKELDKAQHLAEQSSALSRKCADYSPAWAQSLCASVWTAIFRDGRAQR